MERHYRYLKPGNQEVVHWHRPSPENPRPVEVHTNLARMLWGDTRFPDISKQLWAGSWTGQLNDVPVLFPRDEHLFAHLALHTLDHLMLQKGRGIQFVDLSIMAAKGLPVDQTLNPNWIYPALKLASRCMPAWWQKVDLSEMEPSVSNPIILWANSVPIDGRCGMRVDPRPPAIRRFAIHWERWRPSFWRLLITHPDTPLPRALARHIQKVFTHALRRLFMGREPSDVFQQ
jgi:hypothetical protein